MKKITSLNFIDLSETLIEGTKRLLVNKGYQLDESGISVSVSQGEHICVKIEYSKASIIYSKGHYFRALGILLEHIQEKEFFIIEYPKFQNLGVQLDLSRNGALKVDAIKKYMDNITLMGYTK